MRDLSGYEGHTPGPWEATWDKEPKWQIDRLVCWLMEPDAEVLPLPEKHGVPS
jgi:hypothetical protein